MTLRHTASVRSIGFIAAAFLAALLVAGCGHTRRHTALPSATSSSSALGSASRTSATTPVSTSTRSGTTGATSIAPAPTRVPRPSSSTAMTTGSTGDQLPISDESDSQMKAEGNDGPSSSILLPTSCQQTGTTVTAGGTYTNSGFVPNVYNRYGDVIVLYVFAAPSPGYAQGIQLGSSDVSASPAVGISAPWHVSVSISPSLGAPARCVVAAQPTHDVQLAP